MIVGEETLLIRLGKRDVSFRIKRSEFNWNTLAKCCLRVRTGRNVQ
jgi:hypothetical protein